MGEAKRRKQKLGEAYGKKQPPLKDQNRTEIHLKRFISQSVVKVNEILEGVIDNDEETIKEYRQTTEKELIAEFRTWLDNYLANYEPEDQMLLASVNADLLLDTFSEASSSRKSKMVYSMAIILEASADYLDEGMKEEVMDFLDTTDEFFERVIAVETKYIEEEADRDRD